MSPRTAPTRTASLSPIDGLLLARAGASLQPHTNQRRPATPWQNAKKGLQHALRRRGLSPVAPLAQTAPSALVWVGVEGVGQLGGRVAREVERDSFMCLLTALPPTALPPNSSASLRGVQGKARSPVTYCSQQRWPGRVPGLQGRIIIASTPHLCVWV